MAKFKEGDKCSICGRKWKKGLLFANHHVSYDKAITVIVCYICHALLHGNARIWKHPFAEHGKDLGPLKFARKVVSVHKKALKDK